MAVDGPGVLPFVRGIDLSRNDFHVGAFIIFYIWLLKFYLPNHSIGDGDIKKCY